MSQRCGLPVILCAIWMGAVVGCGEDAESGDMNVCHWDDIELGMTMQQVTDLVGEPEEIIEPDEDVPSTAWWYQGVMYGGRAVVDPKNWARIRASLPRRRSFRHDRRTR